jgi:ribonucleotide reductase beta subunit family protein with ferritin-like domain
MIDEAVQIEMKFITESIPCNMIGMNADLMKDYIMYIADRLMIMLGYEKMYEKSNPFQFAEISSLEGKSSFFEVRVSEYAKPVSLQGGKSVIPTELSINPEDADF